MENFTYVIEMRGKTICHYSLSPLREEELIRNSHWLTNCISGLVKVIHTKDGQYGELIRLKNKMTDRFEQPWFDSELESELTFEKFKKAVEKQLR